jgi:hypothetical protein
LGYSSKNYPLAIMDYYKKDKSGATLDPRRHNIPLYIRDMEKRNKELERARKSKVSDAVISTVTDDHRQIFGIEMEGSNGKYRAAYEQIDWRK